MYNDDIILEYHPTVNYRLLHGPDGDVGRDGVFWHFMNGLDDNLSIDIGRYRASFSNGFRIRSYESLFA